MTSLRFLGGRRRRRRHSPPVLTFSFLRYVTVHNSWLRWMERSGQREGGAWLFVELSPHPSRLKGQAHKMAASWPQQSVRMSARTEIREIPSICYPSRYAAVTYSGVRRLSRLSSLPAMVVCLLCHYPATGVCKKGPHPPSCAHHAF